MTHRASPSLHGYTDAPARTFLVSTMSTEASSPPAPATPTSTRDGNVRPPRAGRTRTLLTLAVIALLAILTGGLAYTHLSGRELAPDSEDELALSIIGGWGENPRRPPPAHEW